MIWINCLLSLLRRWVAFDLFILWVSLTLWVIVWLGTCSKCLFCTHRCPYCIRDSFLVLLSCQFSSIPLKKQFLWCSLSKESSDGWCLRLERERERPGLCGLCRFLTGYHGLDFVVEWVIKDWTKLITLTQMIYALSKTKRMFVILTDRIAQGWGCKVMRCQTEDVSSSCDQQIVRKAFSILSISKLSSWRILFYWALGMLCVCTRNSRHLKSLVPSVVPSCITTGELLVCVVILKVCFSIGFMQYCMFLWFAMMYHVP